MSYNFRNGGLFLALWLAGCAQELRPPAEQTAVIEYPADLQGAELYRLSGAESSLRILVYRGGTLASLGHNHVLGSHALSGYVWRHPQLTRAGFALAVPVDTFIVDDNDARREEGADFPVNISEQAKEGTRRNLLGPAVLDAERFPRVLLKSLEISGADAPQVVAALTIKDVTRRIAMPVALREDGGALRVRGEFAIEQTAFGITPYSVALGALQVQNELRIKFELVARPVE